MEISDRIFVIKNFLVDRVPKWDSLWRLRSNGLVKTAVIWFVLVPVLAKLFDKVGETVELKIGAQSLIFSLSLPFSWQLFFWAACCFSVGGFLVNWRCPEIIKEHAIFDDFKKAGKGWPQLNWYVKKLYYNDLTLRFSEDGRGYIDQYLKDFHDKSGLFQRDEKYDSNVIAFFLRNRCGEEDEGLAYNWIYRRSSDHGFWMRVVILLIYCIGFGLFLWVAFQNVMYVFYAGGIYPVVKNWLVFAV